MLLLLCSIFNQCCALDLSKMLLMLILFYIRQDVPCFGVDMIFQDNIYVAVLQHIFYILHILHVLPPRQDVAYFGVDMTKDPPEPKLTYYHCVEGECIKV